MAFALVTGGLSGVLSVSQVVSAPPAAAAIGDNPQDEATALAQAAAAGKRVEVASERGEYETVWANPNGTLTKETAQTPIRVQQPDGSWTDIDLSLDAAGDRLSPANSVTDVSFSATGDGQLATLRTAGGTSVSLDFAGDVDAPAVDDASATYPVSGADPATVKVAATKGGFTERVVLPAAPQTAPSYTFPLTLNGLTPSLDENVLSLANDAGTVVAQSGRLTMWDSSLDQAGDRANQVPVDAKLVTSGAGTSLVLTPSLTWLQDPGTKYPVTVDPDVSSVSVLTDTYTNSGSPDTNYIGDYKLRIGTLDGTAKFRSYVGFRTADYNGRDVSSATLKVYQYYGATCTAKQTNIYSAADRTLSDTNVNLWKTVPTNTLSWNKQDGANGKQAVTDLDPQWSTSVTSNNGASGCTAGGWVNFDVTRMVNSWTSGEKVGSFSLRAGSESDTSFEKRFCAGNPDTSTPCNSSSLEPVLSLSYYPAAGAQDWYSMTSHPLNDRSTLMVNNDNGNAVVQANDVKLNGQGLDLSIDRYYNSQATEATTSLGTGGWSLSVGPDVYLEAGTGNYRYDYHAPGGTRFGAFVRKSTTSADANYTKFFAPQYGGIDADLADDGTGSGVSTFTMTFHGSQQKYVFKKVDTASNNLYLASMKDRSGNHIDFNYVAGTHQLASITDSAGRTITVTYTSGRISQITSTTSTTTNSVTATRTWQYGYTGSQLTSYTNPDGKVTTYSSGQLTSITNPIPKAGAPAPTTTLTYYSGAAVHTVSYALGSSSVSFAFNYASPGASKCPGSPDRSTAVLDTTTGDAANGQGPTYCFRDRANGDAKLNVLDALNHSKEISYTADNQSASSTTAGNASVTNSSTVLAYGDYTDQLSSVTEPKDSDGDSAAQVSLAYDTPSTSAGNNWLPSAQRDPSGNCTNFGYDSAGRTTDAYTGYAATGAQADSCTKPSGAKHFHKDYNNSDGSINYTYDGNGSSTAGERTDYTYWATGDSGYVANTAGQLKSVVKPGGSCASGSRRLCTSYSYDGAARISTMTDGRLKLTRYTYDALDRVTMVQLNSATTCTATDISVGNCLTYTYDAEGNLTARTDKTGTSTFVYDRINRQLSQTLTSGGSTVYTVSWTRDGAGNLTQYTQTKAGSPADVVTYTYDIANRPDTVQDATGTIDIDTDADGRTNAITYPTGTDIKGTYSYTKRGKPDTFAYTSGGSSSLLKYVYSYKDGTKELSQLKKETVSGSSTTNQVLTYDYNESGQLTAANNDAGQDYDYTYDDAGNLKRSYTNTGFLDIWSFYGYDRAGELCWRGTSETNSPPPTQLGTSCPATPTSSGDYTARTSDAAGNNLGTTSAANTYNGNSQATTVGGTTQTYNDLGNDLRATAGANTFINGPLGVTARYTSGGITYYTRDPSGQILDEHGASGTRYYLGDYQSSVSALVSTSGSLMATYAYDPYGAGTVNAQNGGTTATDNPWRYTCGYYDTEGDGNYHLGARYYDTAGHFTQPDSVQGNIENPNSLNGYGYGGGDPVNHSDPNGNSYNPDVEGCVSSSVLLTGTILATALSPPVGAVAIGLSLAVGLGSSYYLGKSCDFLHY